MGIKLLDLRQFSNLKTSISAPQSKNVVYALQIISKCLMRYRVGINCIQPFGNLRLPHKVVRKSIRGCNHSLWMTKVMSLICSISISIIFRHKLNLWTTTTVRKWKQGWGCYKNAVRDHNSSLMFINHDNNIYWRNNSNLI